MVCLTGILSLSLSLCGVQTVATFSSINNIPLGNLLHHHHHQKEREREREAARMMMMRSTKSLNKSGTVDHLKNSPSNSMEVLPNRAPQPTTYNGHPKKSASVEFLTTSPQPAATNNNIGQQEEILHCNRHHHPLAPLTIPDLFTCSGCREYGAGKRFACQLCDFQLHEFCALSPPSLSSHPLHPQHQLLFLPKTKPVKGGMMWRKCDICAKPMMGFAFGCGASLCSFQMHPCCAMLSSQVNFPVLHPHTLKLLPPSSTLTTITSGADHQHQQQQQQQPASAACVECNRKRSGRLYGCTVCQNYHLHAVCAKNMINGLHGTNPPPANNSNMLGAAFRIASIVVVQFIGSLAEGLGEGIGQALLQNMSGGGRCLGRGRQRQPRG